MNRRPALVFVLSWFMVLTGCAGGSSKRAVQLYEAGQYAEALREAEQRAQTAQPPERDRAALIAGMSAYELRRYPEAERWLRPLTHSATPEVAAKAGATMGLIQVSRERYSAAAIDFSSAARRMTGDEAARAWFFAGECYSIMGRLDQAEDAYGKARALAQDSGVRTRVDNRMKAGSYTLQLGAFANRANADRALALGAQRASRAGLPAPVIVATPDVTGRTIFLVQVGRYGSRDEASADRSRLGGDAVVVQAR